MVDVSVIIPTYNRANYLKNAIENMRAQTFQNWELIVVDDGSTDETSKLMSQMAEEDKRILYLRKANEGRAGLARNIGIEKAQGKYVAFLDDDDLWVTHKLERQVCYMECHPEIGFSYSWYEIFGMRDQTKRLAGRIPEKPALKFGDFLRVFVAHSAMMIRRSSIKGNEWFDPNCIHSEDYYLCLCLAELCQAGFIDEALAFTVMDERVHRGANMATTAKAVIHILEDLYPKPSFRRFRREIRQEIARRHYYLGHDHLDQSDFLEAACHFLQALAKEPLIRFTARREGEKGISLFISVVKSYLAVPSCFLKGLIDGRR